MTIVNCCRLCGFNFYGTNVKRKRNIASDFVKIFEIVCSQERGSDGRPQAICDTCKYRVLRAWKNCDDSAAALKRKHPVSSLTSSQSDKETATVVQRKKPGQRLLFEPEGGRTEDHNSVFQRELSKVIDLNITKTSEACSQTSMCHCAPSARNKTCVKVCMYYYYYLFEYKWKRIKKMESLKNIAKIIRSQLNNKEQYYCHANPTRTPVCIS